MVTESKAMRLTIKAGFLFAAVALFVSCDSSKKEDLNRNELAVAAKEKARGGNYTTPTTPTTPRESSEVQTPEIRSLIGVTSLEMATSPTVAIVAMVDEAPRTLTSDTSRVAIMVRRPGEPTPSALPDPVVAMAEMVKLVAPNVTFVFVLTFASYTSELAQDLLVDFLKSTPADPDILLVCFPLHPGDIVMAEVFQTFTGQGILVVLPAWNKPGPSAAPFAESKHTRNLLTVSSVDLKGYPSVFTTHEANGLWGPGEMVPIPVQGGGRIELVSGSGPATALAAGIAARILDEYPAIDPVSLIEILRSSSRPIVKDGPPIINLELALQALSQHEQARN